jgi:AmmeMemoRadiSam system protein B
MWHRKPAVAGSFYPGSPQELEKEIKQYLADAVSPPVEGEIVGLISPHAGYIYSGPVAAYSFKQLMNADIDVAVVLAPCHRGHFESASIIPEGIYETPLGNVEIDSAIGKLLIEEPCFEFIREAHKLEHSLEVQVPFLQTVLPKFTIVPIVIGTSRLPLCAMIAGAISGILKSEKRKYCIIISTDLSHYHTYAEAQTLDGVFIEALQSFDEQKVAQAVSSRHAEACGIGPVLTGMFVCKKLGAGSVEILKYENSGDTAGGKDQVVGYLAAAFVK